MNTITRKKREKTRCNSFIGSGLRPDIGLCTNVHQAATIRLSVSHAWYHLIESSPKLYKTTTVTLKRSRPSTYPCTNRYKWVKPGLEGSFLNLALHPEYCPLSPTTTVVCIGQAAIKNSISLLCLSCYLSYLNPMKQLIWSQWMVSTRKKKLWAHWGTGAIRDTLE